MPLCDAQSARVLSYVVKRPEVHVYDSNSKLLRIEFVPGHVRSGEIGFVDDDGKRTRTEFAAGHGRRGEIHFFGNDGKLVHKTFACDHTQHGETEFFGGNAQLVRKEFAPSHAKFGRIDYYDDARKRVRTEFMPGHAMHDELHFYDDNGKLERKEFLPEHIKSGLIDYVDEDGELTRREYVAGQAYHGEILAFRGDGKHTRTEYAAGHVCHGEISFFGDDGKHTRTEYAAGHVHHGEICFFGDDGKYTRREYAAGHVHHGEICFFGNDGKHTRREYAAGHVRHGEICFFGDDGKHTRKEFGPGHGKFGKIVLVGTNVLVDGRRLNQTYYAFDMPLVSAPPVSMPQSVRGWLMSLDIKRLRYLCTLVGIEKTAWSLKKRIKNNLQRNVNYAWASCDRARQIIEAGQKARSSWHSWMAFVNAAEGWYKLFVNGDLSKESPDPNVEMVTTTADATARFDRAVCPASGGRPEWPSYDMVMVVLKRAKVFKRTADKDEGDTLTCEGGTISLRDPISQARIVNPCRGATCAHEQPFDLRTFLDRNGQHCPVCDEPCALDKLLVDKDVEDILKDAPPHVDCVVIAPDGSWDLRTMPPSKRQKMINVDLGTERRPIDLSWSE